MNDIRITITITIREGNKITAIRSYRLGHALDLIFDIIIKEFSTRYLL